MKFFIHRKNLRIYDNSRGHWDPSLIFVFCAYVEEDNIIFIQARSSYNQSNEKRNQIECICDMRQYEWQKEIAKNNP